ncbi:(S)-benzoin forming benzil reductase [Litchfieldia salsa]|uniref:Benzil reductase ((S)-benzoin forming) n=1 Tax=Litchfieldia salsa TaxID=930152 RepID=A0A1H0WPW3_9BACI|nr:(S)-benzoin forming benzil reductase [Litchfieldia salsa]SDP92495.1 benzil reductase ((S)-benzoin forming) [Litchfieldia salsa]
MKYFIITGTSRGLGKSLTEQLIKDDHTIFCISRRQNNELKDLAAKAGINLYYFSCDLQKVEETERVMEKIFTTIDFTKAEGIYLINNAGVVEPIHPVGKATSTEIAMNLQINLMAPMILSTSFIRYTADINTTKMIVNISSGAANRPIFGWGAYCSSKAGLDMFTKTVGFEQESESNPVTVISFSPGIMDTEMQSTIRQSDKADFKEVEKFIEFNETGQLRTTEQVSAILLNLLFQGSPENGRVYDIKEFI